MIPLLTLGMEPTWINNIVHVKLGEPVLAGCPINIGLTVEI